MLDSKTLNIAGRMERLPVSRFTWRIVLLTGLAWFIESLSIGSLGVILDPLKKVMQLSPGQVGILTAASTFGIVVGLIPAGFLSDRFGRTRILVWGIVVYSVLTLLCAVSTNFPVLLTFRFLSGLGMGAVFPLPYAIVSEFVNHKQRTLFNGCMDACLSVGYFIAPLLGMLILPNLAANIAWRVFFMVSALPILYAYVIHVFLPESPRWLARKGKLDEANKVMNYMEHRVEKNIKRSLPKPAKLAETITRPKENARATERVSVLAPWKPPFTRRTISRSVAAIGTFFMFYIVMTYMPTIFAAKGLSMAHSLLFTAIITGAAIPGKLMNGHFAERFGRKAVYLVFMGVAGVAALFFGIASSPTSMVIYACVMSFFGTGAFPALKMSYAEQYPTHMRTTGAATVETVGRFVGGVVGSYAMPVILAQGGLAIGFYIIAVVAFVSLGVEVSLSPETKEMTLEQLETKLVNF